ncbi:MAG TPA: PAS domain-containing protein, partial [Salinivirgaceae bacterium]|nr:PAS domain-containing protein [Salinivirgaceae bacterium]
MRYCLFFTFFTILFTSKANIDSPRVLFLMSYEENFPTYIDFRKAFDEHPIHDKIIADFFYLDTKYSSEDEYLSMISDFVFEKYLRRHQYKAILTYDDNALKIANNIFKKHNISTPIVFGGLNNESTLTSIEEFQITGVVENIDISSTINLMISLKPNLNTIYIITDETETANSDLMKFYKTMEQFPDLGYKIISLTDYTFEEFYNYVSTLYDKNGAFLLLAMHKDKNREYFPFFKGLKSLVDLAHMPIFHVYKHGIGQGIVGGVVVDHQLLTNKCLGLLDSVIINNHIPPIDKNTPLVSMIDIAQLNRNGLNSLNIPENVLVVDSEKKLINISANRVKSLIGIIIGLVSIILFTLILIRKLRNTNAKLYQERELYQKLFVDSPSPMFIVNPQSFSIEEVNHAAVEAYGYSHEEFKQKKISDLNKLPEDSVQTMVHNICSGKINRISAKHYKKSGEMMFVDTFNSVLWYENEWKIIPK